jgi:transcription termination factor Rho
MSVLDRSALEASPLADLHAIASELGLDGFRRLRKADLVDAILARQEGNGGEPAEADVKAEPEAEADAEPEASEDADSDEADDQEEREERPARRRRGGRGRGRGRGRAEDEDAQREEPAAEEEPEERTVEGTVELLSNGSGFVRVAPPDPSDDDVYVSAAQVRRCELVAGDKVTGPVGRTRSS